MQLLAEQLNELTSGDETRAESAAQKIARIGRTTIPEVSRLLDSPEPDHRWWAIRTLAQIPETPADIFTSRLKDPSAEVRQAAALALAAHPDQEALPALLQALTDEDSLVGTLVVKALIRVGRPAVPAMLEALPGIPTAGQIRLMQVLAEIGDPRSIPVMMKAMETDSALLNHWAELGLERLGLDMVYIKLG